MHTIDAPVSSIRRATVDDLVDQGGALFAAHWEEIALNKRIMVPKPDIEQYQALERAGRLLILAAHAPDGALAGYSVNFLTHHLHYADLRVLSNDLLYVAKAHRRGRLGLRLIRATEARAKDAGAQLVLWHAKPATALDALLPRLGYGVQDVIYSQEV